MNVLRAAFFTSLFAFATAAPSFGVSAFAAPTVVIYPLTLSGSATNAEVGSDVAIVIGMRVGEGGSVIVRPATPGTARAEFLQNAIAEKADYYVTGYLQQIGNDVSMILQVVSTHSGTLVYSSTTTIKTYGDAAGEGDALRAAILRHAGRGLAALDAPAPANVPSAAPTANQGVNITRALHRKTRETPAPSPSATSDAGLVPVSEIQASVASPQPRTSPIVAVVTASPFHPSPAPMPSAPSAAAAATPVSAPQITPIPRSAGGRTRTNADASNTLVLDTQGAGDADERARVSLSLALALRRIGVPAARLPVAAAQISPADVAPICRANPGAERLYEPSLALSSNAAGAAVAAIEIVSIDCAGTIAGRRDATGAGTQPNLAIDRAAKTIAPLLSGL